MINKTNKQTHFLAFFVLLEWKFIYNKLVYIYKVSIDFSFYIGTIVTVFGFISLTILITLFIQ